MFSPLFIKAKVMKPLFTLVIIQADFEMKKRAHFPCIKEVNEAKDIRLNSY
jgi:hypothetical protein